MKRSALWVLALLSISILGCAAEAPSLPKVMLDSVEARKLGYAVAWTNNLVLPLEHNDVVIDKAHDLLFFMENNTHLITAVNLRDGTIAWRKMLGDPSDRLLGTLPIPGSVLVTSENQMHRLNPENGQVLQTLTLLQATTTKPALAGNGAAVFGGINGLVYAQDYNNGLKRWSYQMTDSVQFAPVENNNVVFAADRRGIVVSLLSSSGDSVWRRQPTDGVTAALNVTADTLYIATLENKIHAINRASSRDRWIYRSTHPLRQSAVVLAGLVLQPLPTGAWVAIQADTGNELFQLTGPIHSVLPFGSNLLLGTPDAIKIIDSATGKTIAEHPTHKTVKIMPGQGEQILLIGNQGDIMAIVPSL